MKVTVAYTGQLAAAAGAVEEELALDEGTRLDAVLRALAERHAGKFSELLFDDSDRLRSTLLIALDGEQLCDAAESVVLKDGASLMLMTPIAGG
jgi:molybdopterin converting factor small subunit